MRRTRTLLTLLVCSTVVLAGCTGMGGLSGDSGGGANDEATAGDGAGGSGSGGNDGAGDSGGADDSASGNSTNESGATSRSGTNSGGGNQSNSDGGASDSNADSNSGSVNATNWLDFSEAGRHYVFELSSAGNGSGELAVDTTEETIHVQAEKGVFGTDAVDRTIPQRDDATTLAGTEMAGNEALTDTDIANSLEGIRYLLDLLSSVVVTTIGEDQVEVGYSDNGTEITGMDSYAGIECYVTTYEDSTGALSADVCLVPGEAAPHIIGYNTTTGEVDTEITLTEYNRE